MKQSNSCDSRILGNMYERMDELLAASCWLQACISLILAKADR